MNRQQASRLGFRILVVVVAIGVPLVVFGRLRDLPPPIAIKIDGAAHQVSQQTTLGQVINTFKLHATSGRLLDVEGKVIEYRSDPGQILLNGAKALRSTTLVTGDAITVVNGDDTTEGTRRVVSPVKGLKPGNPQTNLGTSRVQQITVEGRISLKVVKLVYRPIGKAKQPPEVALTFDDGPWPSSSERILSILERMHVRATFFLVGYLVDRYPAIARDEARAGMTIGNHSWDHPTSPPFAELKPHRIRSEMARTNDALAKIEVEPFLFRPPGGSSSAEVVQTARVEGMRVVRWEVDPHDYRSSATPKSIRRYVLSHVGPGSIVLMHDGGGDQSATVAALPGIIRGIRKMGLQLVAIPR